MIRRLAGVAVVVFALFGMLGADAGAEVPSGARLTFTRWSGARFELISADAAGQDRRLIAGGGRKARPLPITFSSPTWSGDGTHVVFSGLSQVRSKVQVDLYEAAPDGSDLTKLAHTTEGFNPVLSPDGRTVAFVRERQRQGRRPHRGEVTVFKSISTWLLDLDSGVVRQFTPWRNGLSEFPASFSPDGSSLALSTRLDRAGRQPRFVALAVRLDGSGSTVLGRGVAEPIYSPEGTRIALIAIGKTRTFKGEGAKTTIRYTDLAVANADGSGLRKLTDTKAIELKPSWDPSGERLAYTQQKAAPGEGNVLGFGDSLMEINADGSCRTRLLSYPNAALYGVVWQPGPGREAGPIAC